MGEIFLRSNIKRKKGENVLDDGQLNVLYFTGQTEMARFLHRLFLLKFSTSFSLDSRSIELRHFCHTFGSEKDASIGCPNGVIQFLLV